MRLFLYYLVGMVLGAVSVAAMADTIPATPGQTVSYWTYWGGSQSDPNWCQTYGSVDQAEACSKLGGTYGYAGRCLPPSGVDKCTGGWNNNAACTLGYVNPSLCQVTTYTCPDGYTLEGQNCVSNAPPCPEAGSSAMIGGAAAWGIDGNSTGCTTGFGFSGCGIKCSGGVSSGGKASCTGCTYTGENYDSQASGAVNGSPVPEEEHQNPTTPEGCMSQGKGYITSSGVTSCVDSSQSATPVSATSSSSTSSTSGGSTSYTDTITTTTFSAGNVSTTSQSSGTAGNSSATSTQSVSEYCKANPSSPLCNGSDDPCVKNPDRAGCKPLGVPDAGPDIPQESRGVEEITPYSFGSASASCPSAVQVGPVSFSYDKLCEALGWLKPLVLAIAWLSAGAIVMGVARNG